MAEINLEAFGYNQSEDVTGAKTLDAGDCGVVQNVTASATVTLPATAALRNFMVRVGAPGITVNVSPNASDYIIGNGSTATTDNKDLIFTDQPVGSYVQLSADGTNGYVVTRINGVATFES